MVIGCIVICKISEKESPRAREEKTNIPIFGTMGLARLPAVVLVVEPMAARKSPRKFWAALETEHRSENLARLSVQDIGVEVCFLQYRARPVRGVRHATPLFQGYIIARIDHEDRSALRSCRGVRSLVLGAGGCVGRVPDGEMEYLQSLVGADGYVQLDRENPPAFLLHDAVRATTGMFGYFMGEYRGLDQNNSRRAMVAFSFMGREVVSSLSRYDLVLAV